MIDNFFSSHYVLKCGCVKSYGMTSCDVWRRYVTSFEFRIAVENICRIVDVMNDTILSSHIRWLERGCVHSCSMTSCDGL
jgi:hypothetical protein